jgi:hypothetical protein
MATAKLGAILTDLAGSIGGTTFKRNGTNLVVMNKVSGASNNRILTNPALRKNIQVIQGWSKLNNQELQIWNSYSGRFSFPDKFGSQRVATPRELYIKLMGNLSNVNEVVYDIQNLDSTQGSYERINLVHGGSGGFDVNFVGGSDIHFVLVQLQGFGFRNIAPIFNNRKYIYARPLLLNTFSILPEVVFDTLGSNQEDYGYYVYITPMNRSGFKGQTEVIKTKITF